MKLTIKHKKESDMLTMYESVRDVMIVLKDVEEKGLAFKGIIENEFVEVEIDTKINLMDRILKSSTKINEKDSDEND